MSQDIINTVLIDDDIMYAEELTGVAAEQNIRIIHFTNLQKAKEEMMEMTNVDFVILDALCFTEESDTSGDFDFIPYALLAIKELEEHWHRPLPFCINTGYYSERKLDKLRETNAVFDKVDDQQALFTHIRQTIESGAVYKIKSYYRDVFDIFKQSFLDHSVEESVLDLLMLLHSPQGEIKKNELKAYAAKIRSVQEAIFKNLNDYFPELLPTHCFKGDMVDFNKAKNYLSGKLREGDRYVDNHKDIQGDEMAQLSETIYWVCGGLIHYELDPVYVPGKYTIFSLIYSLLEQLIWYKKLVIKYRAVMIQGK